MARRFKLIGTIAALILLFASTAFAQTSATDKFLLEEMLKLASKGQPEAEYHVGMFFNNGIGTAANPTRRSSGSRSLPKQAIRSVPTSLDAITTANSRALSSRTKRSD